jgi:hypothetical protein
MATEAVVTGLYHDLRRWLALAAIVAAFVAAGAWWLMELEAATSPSFCIFRQCDNAHVPGPGVALWFAGLVLASWCGIAALAVATVDGVRWLRYRDPVTPERLAVVAGGPLALVVLWIVQASTVGAYSLHIWIANLTVAVVVVPLAVFGSSFLWVGGVATGVVLVVRREAPPWASVSLILASIASGAIGMWLLYFGGSL